jgi:hypothetical protein
LFRTLRQIVKLREQLRSHVEHLGIITGTSTVVPRPIAPDSEIFALGILDGVLVASLYPNIAKVTMVTYI